MLAVTTISSSAPKDAGALQGHLIRIEGLIVELNRHADALALAAEMVQPVPQGGDASGAGSPNLTLSRLEADLAAAVRRIESLLPILS